MFNQPTPPLHSATPVFPSRPTCAPLKFPGPAEGDKHQTCTLGQDEALGPLLPSSRTICCCHCGTRAGAGSAASAPLRVPLHLPLWLGAVSSLLAATALCHKWKPWRQQGSRPGGSRLHFMAQGSEPFVCLDIAVALQLQQNPPECIC